MRVITHRGLDPSIPDYFPEGTLEAFSDQLSRGYGLEFDVRTTKDNKLVVIHDETLERYSGGSDLRNVSDVELEELVSMRFNGCRLASFSELLDTLEAKQSLEAISAIHVKHVCQTQERLDLILAELSGRNASRFMLFDVTLDTARYIRDRNPSLLLAPSVAHPYDIKRYNDAVGGTLISLGEAVENCKLFDWVWLDEWDRTDEHGREKTLYTKATFDTLRKVGLSIALVSPELHATSPHLLGGESHPDAKDRETLHARLRDIVSLAPDAICTDYPDILKSIAST